MPKRQLIPPPASPPHLSPPRALTHQTRPERWLEFEHAPSPYRCLSFHAGPRTCLGQRLAELEGVYVLVLLLRHFRLRLLPGQDVRYDLSASMPMRRGLWATVEARRA